MSNHTEDNYTTDGVGLAGVEQLAQRAVDGTGRSQRIHVHGAGGRCVPGCHLVTALAHDLADHYTMTLDEAVTAVKP